MTTSLLKGKLLNVTASARASETATAVTATTAVTDPTFKYEDWEYATKYPKTTNRFSEVKAQPDTTIVSYATNNVGAEKDNRGKCVILTFSDNKIKYVKRGENFQSDMFIGMTARRFNKLIEMEILITATR